jgi:hypothetical protein
MKATQIWFSAPARLERDANGVRRPLHSDCLHVQADLNFFPLLPPPRT